VRGKVLQGPGGPPVKKANVQLNGRLGGKPGQYSAITDAEGQFTVSEVQAGRYIAVVEHPGFVQSAAGKGRASITVQAGSAKNELILYMEPAAIITGKIVDLDGDAMRDVSVMATRDGSSAGARTAHNFGYGNTNDLGEFRISDLRAGRYKITASPRQGARPAQAEDNGAKTQTIYLPTRYPGVLSEEQAVALEIHAGTETRVDFGLLTGRAFRVSGSVAGVPSKSSMAQIVLEPQAGGGSQPEPQELGETGKFEFKNVLPGSYSARLILVTFDGGKPGMEMLSFGQPIEVGNSDVHGLLLQPEPGGQVKGKFRLDTDQKFDWTQLWVTLISLDGRGVAFESGREMSGPPLSTKLKLDGSFEVESVPGGNYQLYVGGDPNKLADYFTKSVSLDGRDVSDSGFSITAKTYLDVVVSANGASIAGKVVDDKGQPVADATVVDIPSAEHRARFDLYQRITTDASGNFNLRGLSAGKYSVLAFEELREDVRDADFLKAHEGRGEVVQLDEGSKKSVLLKLIAYEDAAP
jgi:protocatechuate 3,4-dioxygenase beta subunit